MVTLSDLPDTLLFKEQIEKHNEALNYFSMRNTWKTYSSINSVLKPAELTLFNIVPDINSITFC